MFSIIIPTYNRSDCLRRAINSYIKQSAIYLIEEVIIIDDGSDEEQKLANYEIVETAIKQANFPIKYIYQDNKGPASARNYGISIACGDIVLITGDDILPHINMVKEHFFSHKKYDMDKRICVLGHSIWPPDIKVTPFMKHIQEMGLQFGYSIIPDPEDVPFNFFYTSNVSLNREFLLEDKLFDTDFPYAAWEDIELSYRLKKRGMRIVYNKDAIGYHYHPITFTSFRQRQEKCGYSAYIFYKKHPELKQFLGIDMIKHNIKDNIFVKELICLLLEKLDLKLSLPKYYDQVMKYYYIKGLEKYIKNMK